MTTHSLAIADFSRRREARCWDWLSASEQARCRSFSRPARRVAWLAGRWAAKQAVAAAVSWTGGFDRLHIESRDGNGRPVAPVATIDGARVACSLTLSHSQRTALAAASAEGWAVGCDASPLAPLGIGVARFWFGPAEREWIDGAAAKSACGVVWGLKEACFKALGGGVPFRPRRWDSVAILRSLAVEPPVDLSWVNRGAIQCASRLARLVVTIDARHSEVAVELGVKRSEETAIFVPDREPLERTWSRD